MIGQSLMHATILGILQMQKFNHDFLLLEHILLGMIEQNRSNKLLLACNVDISLLGFDLTRILEQTPSNTLQEGIRDPKEVLQAPAVQRTIQRSFLFAQKRGNTTAEVEDFFLALFDEEDSWATYYLKKHGLKQELIHEYLSLGDPTEGLNETSDTQHFFIVEDFIGKKDPSTQDQAANKAHKNPEEDFLSEDLSKKSTEDIFKHFTTDLVELAKNDELDPCIGREKELQRILEVLSRRKKNNPLLVGEPGTGKTALAEGLALAIAKGDMPEQFKDTSVFSLDLGSLVAGTRYRGDFEQRVKAVVTEILKRPNSILVIDEIHNLVGAGNSSSTAMDASNLLKPALASGKMRCIGSTTHEDYRSSFDTDKALARRFQRIDMQQPSRDETLAILKGLKKHYEAFHTVRYSAKSLETAVDLSIKYLQDRFLPDKAIDVMDEVAASLRIKSDFEPNVLIQVSHVISVIARMANIPEQSISREEKERLQTLDTDLKAHIFGQDTAIDAVYRTILRARAGLAHEHRPQASFLFHGPTGVGKTELAKVLANLLDIPFLRLDMSEYMEMHAVARLIGSPPGYIGHDKGGILTEMIRKNPHAVLLLDEIEKAHADIYNILLQVMDYASLTDSSGKKVDFRHIILILTTNAGAREMDHNPLGFSTSTQAQNKSIKAVEKTFTPEFRNRLDAILTFNNLSNTLMLPIVDKSVAQIQQNLAKRKIHLDLADSARIWLADTGYDPKMGARALQRLIRTELEDTLSHMLLFNSVAQGSTVHVSAGSPQAKTLTFTITRAKSTKTVAKSTPKKRDHANQDKPKKNNSKKMKTSPSLA